MRKALNSHSTLQTFTTTHWHGFIPLNSKSSGAIYRNTLWPRQLNSTTNKSLGKKLLTLRTTLSTSRQVRRPRLFIASEKHWRGGVLSTCFILARSLYENTFLHTRADCMYRCHKDYCPPWSWSTRSACSLFTPLGRCRVNRLLVSSSSETLCGDTVNLLFD